MKKYSFLVTGGSGFIGSNLVDYLIDLGHTIYVIDNLSTGKIENILSHFENKKQFKFYNFDLSEEKNIPKLKKITQKVDFVFHLAATPNVQESIDNPLKTNKNNFLSTLNLLESCKNTKVKKIIFSSTSAIYGDSDVLPIDEKTPSNPLSPYGLQKLISEEYLKIYFKLYDIKSVSLRYFNVFGNRMTNDGAYKSVISIFMEQKNNGSDLTITNDGTQKRDFINVIDVVKANYMMCFQEFDSFQIFNVGQGSNLSINEIASYFDSPITYIGKRIEPYETLCNNSKISRLGWNPSISVEFWIKNKLGE